MYSPLLFLAPLLFMKNQPSNMQEERFEHKPDDNLHEKKDGKEPVQGCPKIADVRASIGSGSIRDKTKTYELQIMYPKVYLKDAKIMAKINSKIMGDIKDFQGSIVNDANQAYKESQKEDYFTMQPFIGMTKFKVHRHVNVLSITILYYTDTGGAHGNSFRVPYNYDLRTGDELKLKDLFVPGYNYMPVINQEIKRQIRQQPDLYYHDQYAFKTVKPDQTFYLSPDSLVIYFNPYDIAPFSTGIPEFKIPYTYFGEGLKTNIRC